MRRVLVLAMSLAVALLGADMSDRVLAAPLSKTTLKFSCDRGVGTATVVAQIQVSLFDPTPVGGPQTLSCGPDSISGGRSETDIVSDPLVAGWVHVSTF